MNRVTSPAIATLRISPPAMRRFVMQFVVPSVSRTVSIVSSIMATTCRGKVCEDAAVSVGDPHIRVQ